jgi:hypothetical protein
VTEVLLRACVHSASLALRGMLAASSCAKDCRATLQRARDSAQGTSRPELLGRSQAAHAQASYFLGIALRKQLKYVEASQHLNRALDVALQAGDTIKDEIWRELAACMYTWWQQESIIRRDKQTRLRERLTSMLDAHYRANKTVRSAG